MMMSNEQPLVRILYVDDDSDMRGLVQMTLENTAGMQVMLCDSAEGLTEKIIAAAPQMILLDVRMPGCDGTTILKELKRDARFSHIPVIFLTGVSAAQDGKKFKELGAAGVIDKSFKPLELGNHLRALWQRGYTSTYVQKAQSYEESYRKLHDIFIERLRDDITALEKFMEYHALRTVNRNQANEAMELAHGLAGTGSAFGFPDLAIAAQKLDLFLQGQLKMTTDDFTMNESDLKKSRHLTVGIIGACKKALDHKDAMPSV
jgi:DNA-binding response OmpR family regulator